MTEMPICFGKTIPPDPSIKDVHSDFSKITSFAVQSEIISKDLSKQIEAAQLKYNKKIILQRHLNDIVRFWNLVIGSPSDYVGEVPYYNQLEIHDFVKEFGMNPQQFILVATPDTMINYHECQKEITAIERKIELRRRSFEVENASLIDALNMLDRKIHLIKDPIVLHKIMMLNGEPAYVIVTAWGAEEVALWNLPSLS